MVVADQRAVGDNACRPCVARDAVRVRDGVALAHHVHLAADLRGSNLAKRRGQGGQGGPGGAVHGKNSDGNTHEDVSRHCGILKMRVGLSYQVLQQTIGNIPFGDGKGYSDYCIK